MSYTNDPANNVIDRIRLMVGDTDPYEEGITDEVYQFIIDKHIAILGDTTDAYEKQSALEALKYLVTKYASYVTEKAGGLYVKDSEKYDHYKELLDDWTTNPSLGFIRVGSGFAGGISKSDMQANLDNPDANLNPFRIGDSGASQRGISLSYRDF